MPPRCFFLVLAICLGTTIFGCGERVEEEQIEVKSANDPLNLPRSLLQGYAEGQPLGSEASTFSNMIEDVRKVDPAKAAILEEGLKEIQQAHPSARPGKAKEVLQKIKT